jgi:flagellar biosynthesis GTPase FlhF
MEDKPINPADCRLLSTERKKHKKELEKVRRSKANAWKREQRAREKLKKVEHEAQVQANEAAKAVVEQYKGQFKAWSREKESLKKDLAKLNARNRREPLKIQHAVQKALEHASDSNTDQPTIRYVKDKRGIVQDWARNAIITLVNEGVPMSKTWSVTKANADVLGVTLVGKWSSRTSRRVVHEGGVAAGLMIVEYAQTCIGPW